MVVDIDGTISEVGLRRRRLLEQSPVDWEAFYRDNFEDLPKRDVCSFVQFNARQMEVFFCTSRRFKAVAGRVTGFLAGRQR